MYFGHASWVPVVVLGGVFVVRALSSPRRGGARGGPPGRRSFTDADRPVPPPPGAAPSQDPSAGGTTGTAPGWFRDPFFTHEYRYWSGSEWSEHVTDDGTPGSDPPPATSQGHSRPE